MKKLRSRLFISFALSWFETFLAFGVIGLMVTVYGQKLNNAQQELNNDYNYFDWKSNLYKINILDRFLMEALVIRYFTTLVISPL